MSSDPKLDVALEILKLAGHQIGDADMLQSKRPIPTVCTECE